MGRPEDGSTNLSQRARAQRPAPGRVPEVDVEKLADKVYELMRTELRLATARGERMERRD